jgi:CheY-like chemotaxis protein
MPLKSLGRPAEILLVEDSAGDVELTREALRGAQVPHTLHVVPDGVEALSFLHREGHHAKAPRPDLIFLDLNLPRKDGREVLAEIKADAQLRVIPVIILTTSRADEDILRAYRLYANSYVPKPDDFAGFGKVMRSIRNFWLSVVILPPKE